MSDGLFDGVLAAGPVAALVGDDAWVAAMLAFEGALAEASADEGVLPRAHADVIATVCARLGAVDGGAVDALGRGAVDVEELDARAQGRDALDVGASDVDALSRGAVDVEALDAQAQGRDAPDADAPDADALDTDGLDVGALGRDAVSIGNPAGPLVRALTAAVEHVDPAAAASVHVGATSQDVVDTAAMLVARAAVDAIVADVLATADVLAALAREHARTPQVGRTLLQHATPTTFGLTAAQWLAGLDRAAVVLTAARDRLAVQLGGAAGTLAVFGGRGPAVVAGVARRLGLAEPVAPWHTERSRVTETAAALAQTCGAVAKIAGDVVLLAQAEIGEVRSGDGGSSTMPHKHNPVEAVSALACARQAPGLAATLLATAGAQEFQRAAGSWHAEWAPLRDLLVRAGSAVWWLRACVSSLRPDPERLRAGLAVTGDAALVEGVSIELARTIGRTAAHDALAAAAARPAGSLADTLAADPVIGAALTLTRIAELLDPARHVDAAAALVARILDARQGSDPADERRTRSRA